MKFEYYVIILIIGYLLVNVLLTLNKSKKRQSAFVEMQNKLAVGTSVIFANGLKGEIVKLDKSDMIVKCGEAVLKADRACVQMIVE